MIKEVISNTVQTLTSGSEFGRICHVFVSPETHWSDGICQISVEIRNGKAVDIRLLYGAGGHNKGVTDLEVALAIAEAFRLASARLEQLYVQYDYKKGD